MKRDMELVRNILRHIEEHDDLNFALPDYDEQTIAYHVRALADAGLLEGVACHVGGMDRMIVLEDCYVHLTWEGHEFLDAARDEGRWNQAKRMVREKAGSITFVAMQELLLS